jgi:hypothetical protein
MINYIQMSCDIGSIKSPVIIYDNTSCVTQIQVGYIKSNVSKHITVKLFYPHQLQEVVRLAFCKSNHAIILLIYSQSFHLLTYFTNMLKRH